MSRYIVTKTFDEYVEMFKIKCEELGRTIRAKELRRHEFGLPGDMWFVKFCPDANVKTYRDFIEWLGYENSRRVYTYEIAFEEFKKRGLDLLPQEYKSCAQQLEYTCSKHPNIIQTKSLNHLLFCHIECEVWCYPCMVECYKGENSILWKGGISQLNIYLRYFIAIWKKDSMANCNYKCVITGNNFDAIHHLYSYNKILKETLNELNLPIYTEINKYSLSELESMKIKIMEIHDRHPLGVCLCKEIHNLYHKIIWRR